MKNYFFFSFICLVSVGLHCSTGKIRKADCQQIKQFFVEKGMEKDWKLIKRMFQEVCPNKAEKFYLFMKENSQATSKELIDRANNFHSGSSWQIMQGMLVLDTRGSQPYALVDQHRSDHLVREVSRSASPVVEGALSSIDQSRNGTPVPEKVLSPTDAN